MPKIKKETKSSNVLKFSFIETLRVGAWPSGQRVGSTIRRFRVRVPQRSLAGFVQSRLFRIQIPPAILDLTPLCSIWNICFY